MKKILLNCLKFQTLVFLKCLKHTKNEMKVTIENHKLFLIAVNLTLFNILNS